MSDGKNKKNVSVKVILLGESGVGKSCIILRFIYNSFIPNHISTTLSTCTTKKIVYNNKDLVIYDIWDSAGQEKFRSIAKINYQDAGVVILVYDITNEESFNSIKDYWYPQVKEHSPENSIIALVGAKCDLNENCKVNEEEAISYAKSIKAIYKSTSSLSNIGIDELFEEIGKKILSYDNFKELIENGKGNKKDNEIVEEEKENKDNKKIKPKNKKDNKEDKCCV